MPKYGTALSLVKNNDNTIEGVQVSIKQPYIAAVQYRNGIEIYQEDLTLNQANALRRYLFKQQISDEVGRYTVLPLNLVKGLPDEAKAILNKPDTNEQVSTNITTA